MGALSLTCLTGCGSIIISSGTGPTTTYVPGPSVRIGLLVPLSGPDVVLGQAIKNGAELAISQYDGDATHVTANLVVENAANQPAVKAQALVRQGVIGVVGPGTNSEAAAADPVLGRAGIPQIVVAATADSLSAQGNSYFHRIAASDSQVGTDEAQYLVDAGATTVQVVDDGLSDNTNLLAGLTQTLASDLGIQPVPFTYPAPGITALEAAETLTSEATYPDAVAFVGSAADGGALAGALRDLGFTGTILLGGAAGDPESAATQAWVAGSVDGTADLACACDDPGSNTDQDLTFVTAYTGAYGVAPPEWAAQAFDATNAILSALSPASGTSATTVGVGAVPSAADVERTLGTLDLPGVSGAISFAPGTGNLTSPPLWISQAKDGIVTQQSAVTVASASSGS